ncbi:hypothetical protein FOC1_g10004397 [Fusarium oxysporum f. sp. cubense race 1]|uniref:Uncharacterized protein n=1 Tax=Fusarium oxysporum f. sp. cubense (strain race 1) TaxID=1229664 RepID=N4TN40_FUSC1|nr:hypothetical protein FOC1_g10004397 [Fusarium oxysporum f. sp. cubense race 1]
MCEETLRDSYLEDLSRWAPGDFSPQLVIAELPYGISSAAQSMFEAMVACTDCPCKTEHDFGARLYLGTHRKPEAILRAQDEESVNFDMFLSTHYDWQEVRVHAPREKVVQVVPDPLGDRQLKRKRTEGKSRKIKRLCEVIAKIKSMTAYRLELKVLRNQLYQLHPEWCDSAIDASQSAVSLDYILRHRRGSFTERTKRILAVILASTVFHLYNTPWLQSTWGSTDVLFFRTSSSTILFKPFINTPLSSLHLQFDEAPPKTPESDDMAVDTEPDDINLEDFFNHPCPTACRAEIPQNSQFYLAITNCLDPNVWQGEDGDQLDNLTLRTRIYREIILPLETELSQAYNLPIHGFSNRNNLSNPRLEMQAYPHSAYTVGILCALPLELRAVRALFDTEHNMPTRMRGDSNTYALGTMGQHMIVAACLPSGEYGTNAAADAASNMRRTYQELEFCLLVGIGGGAPSPETDIRLGDVVVNITRCIPYSSTTDYSHPGQENDHLFKAVCSTCLALGECIDAESHVQRRARRPTDQPEIHYGLIASGNRVLKDAAARDRWAKEHGILCFEMEAAGVMNTLPCLVIRGICDYADSYKNKRWQNYAAATAASYAKLLLRHTASSSIEWNTTARIGDKSSLRIYTNGEEPQAKRQRA